MQQQNTQILERYLTDAEVRQLFKTVQAYADVHARRDAAWMLLLLNTGIRVGSMARLTVHHAQQAVKLRRLELGSDICKAKGYGVPVNTRARQALITLLKIRREQGYAPIDDAPLVFSRKHQAMSVRSYQSRMRLWCKRAGLAVAATPHFFRHTLGHRIIQRSTAANPLQVAQVALGHASIKNTTIYTRPSREQVALDMEAIR